MLPTLKKMLINVIQIVLSPPRLVARRLPNNLFQITEQIGTKAFHKNISEHDLEKWFDSTFQAPFKQAQVYTETADYHILLDKNGKRKIIKKPPTKNLENLSHNRVKKTIVDEPFFQKLGISNDKKNQVNKFLELFNDVLDELPKNAKIVDFGCGKGYLTFALFEFLKDKNIESSIVGIDSKIDVIDKLKNKNIHLIAGDIKDYNEPFDVLIALHACNTATDIALEKAILNKSKIILAAPCCHQELYKQVKADKLTPLLKHGIFKERFSALATDAIRGLILESCGYQVQMIEFVDFTHTPKNILIRAIYNPRASNMTKAKDHLREFIDFLNVNQTLMKLRNAANTR